MTSLYTNNNYNNTTYMLNEMSPSLNQGDLFKNYQNKIKYKLERNYNNYDVNTREGFTQQSDGITAQSNNLLDQTNMDSSEKKDIIVLNKEYKESLTKYEELTKKLAFETKEYFKRVNPSSNQYLNKNIMIGNHGMYVTNQGVAKWFGGHPEKIMGQNGCPSQSETIKLDIPWDEKYKMPGSIIPTTPFLISGTPMIEGQTCGNEGSNIFVSEMLPPDITTSYVGPYGNNSAMTFIGGTPTDDIGIQNGNFEQPSISNDSYEYITSASQVPGWNFNNGVLMNNSSVWGYPTYPNGPQAVSIQETNSISQTIQLSTGTYSLSFVGCGRNCCDGSGQSNLIDVQLNGTTFYSFQPPINTWTNYSTSMNVTATGSNTLTFLGTSSGDRSTAIQNVTLTSGSSSTNSSGDFTYDMCKQSAIINGYKFFGLQNVNANTSQGYCAVTNNYVGATQYGTSMTVQSSTILWQSNTGNGQGSSASLTSQGALTVYDSTGKAIYSTPNDKAVPSNFLGCYVAGKEEEKTSGGGHHHHHKKHHHKKHHHKKKKNTTPPPPPPTCQETAQQKGDTYYVLGENSKCYTTSNLNILTKHGGAKNCTKQGDVTSGGGGSIAVYNANDSSSNYWLVVRSNGEMAILRGQTEGDPQGIIWSSGTNDKSKDANSTYTASNGKYGKNYILSGQTLAPGDFIGSPDGKTTLIMQTDGNLVLYTWTLAQNSQTMSDGNNGGGQNATALYEISDSGEKKNMGRLAYVDANSILHEYPLKDYEYVNKYKKISNMNSEGSDISNSTYTGGTVEQCADTCNSMNNCAGFVYDVNGKCWPKDNGMYPRSDITNENGTDTYIRSKGPVKVPLGAATNNLVYTDSLTYQNYINGGNIFDKKYGLAKATSDTNYELKQMETHLNSLGFKLEELTNQYISNNGKIDKQLDTNIKETKAYLSNLKETKNKIQNIGTGVNNILNDSDIVVLQKNYNYLFWSILAIASLIIAINIVKK